MIKRLTRMERSDEEMKHIRDELEKVVENLQKLRNLRDEAGSKVIALDAYKRFLESKLERNE